MKIGLIGYGYWGKILLPKLENFEMWYLCVPQKTIIRETKRG